MKDSLKQMLTELSLPYIGKKRRPGISPKPVIDEVFVGLNLRDIINRDTSRITFLDVHDEVVILDMDTREGYEKILEKMGTR